MALRGKHIVASACLSAAAASVGAQLPLGAELPPEIQADRLLVRAEREARDGDNWSAVELLDSALALYEEHGIAVPSDFWFRYGDVSHRAGLHAAAVEAVARYLTEAGRDGDRYDAALRLLDAAEAALAAEREAAARAEAEAVAKTAALQAAVSDMAVIPAGTFRMGCAVEDDALTTEYICRSAQPVREVRVPAFAISKYEVTFAQWDACAADRVCRHIAKDEGFGRGRRPAINVSWRDTQDYVAWLSGKTGETFRLPTEAEWEYAARAGTTTAYHWGDDIGIGNARCGACEGEGVYIDRTAHVGSFAPNAFGLHDMHGNVAEWVQDCVVFLDELEPERRRFDLMSTYRGAPTDGSAAVSASCRVRIRRGGSFVDGPRGVNSAYRDWGRDGDLASGFRVARTLTGREPQSSVRQFRSEEEINGQ